MTAEIHTHRSDAEMALRRSRLQNLQPGTVRTTFNDYFYSPDGNDRWAAPGRILDDLLLIEHQFEWVSDPNGEQLDYHGTYYRIIKRFLQIVRPQEGSVVYDLGSGHGRVIFTGALTHPAATFKGIEYVGDRVRDCNELREKLGLEDAHFIQGNVRDKDVDFSDGDIFYMFNPFSESTLIEVMDKLSVVGRQKRILVATWAMEYGAGKKVFENIPLLREITSFEDQGVFGMTAAFKLYESSA